MTEFEYTATDVARHVIDMRRDYGAELNRFLNHWAARDDVTAAEVVADTCLIGYGGHYDEAIPDEEQSIDALAQVVAHAWYGLSEKRAYELLIEARQVYARLMRRHGESEAKEAWQRTGWLCAVAADQDHCPTCGRKIRDHDEAGCETPSGQRWCLEHALEALASLWGAEQ